MLKVCDFSVERSGLPVLSGLNFEVAAGKALILRGPNGIGKTTLLRTLAGLQEQSKGTCDFPVDQAAYASHADGIKTALTVRENLAFWADIYGNTVPKDIWEWFDLADLRDRFAGTLSAGQKRRVGLARLGVINRQVLFLDEPTVSLDGFSVKLFTNFLRDQHLAKGGVAAIATHIDLGLDEAETLDLTPFAAEPNGPADSDEAFL